MRHWLITEDDFRESKYTEHFEVKKVGDKVDPCNGIGVFTVSQEQIDALNAGKVLYGSFNWEYAVMIKKCSAKMDERVSE